MLIIFAYHINQQNYMGNKPLNIHLCLFFLNIITLLISDQRNILHETCVTSNMLLRRIFNRGNSNTMLPTALV